MAACVVFPGTTEQVSKVLAFCNDNAIKVFPQGGNTSVCGGSVPDNSGQSVLLNMRKMNRIAWDSLPFNLAMKKVKGDASRKLAVFADADCPFCKRLESEMQGLDNVTIYTFLFPIDSLHPDSARKSAQIWCAPDRVKAWDDGAWVREAALAHAARRATPEPLAA